MAISFVQVATATPQTNQTTVSTAFATNQTAGNLNVIGVGWDDGTTLLTSITDTRGNVYTLCAGPVVAAGSSQAIYFAKNIIGGANTLTVNFNAPAPFVDIRALEYSGLDAIVPFD